MCVRLCIVGLQAAHTGRTEVVRLLLCSDGIDLNQTRRGGSNALIVAAQHGHVACVVALLDAGVDVNHARSTIGQPANTNGSTALCAAVQWGHAGCVRAILSATGVNGNVESVLTVLLPGTVSLSPLHRACRLGHVECVRAMVRAGPIIVDINVRRARKAPVVHAAEHGHWGCVKALLRSDALVLNPQRHDDALSVLHYAARGGEAELVALLLTRGSDRFCVATHGPESTWNGSCTTPLDASKRDQHGKDQPHIYKRVLPVFLSGVDYWQRKHHAGHSCAMQQVVLAVLQTRQRLDTSHSPGSTAAAALEHSTPPTTVHTPWQQKCANVTTTVTDTAMATTTAGSTSAWLPNNLTQLPRLPEEMWLAVLTMLRSADFCKECLL